MRIYTVLILNGSNNRMSVLNIVELQNVVTSASGLSPAAFLSNQLINIQEMVQYDEKRINVNVISNFDTTPIQFVSPVNFSNTVTFESDGGTSGSGSTTTSYVSTIGTTDALGLLTVGGPSNMLELTKNSVKSFYVQNDGNTTFTGSVSANNFITTSDGRRKTCIRPITNYNTVLSSVNGVHFKWDNTGMNDVGVIAQDLQPVLPEAVVETPEGLQVAYMKLIPVLIEAVKNLQARVNNLEKGFNTSQLDD